MGTQLRELVAFSNHLHPKSLYYRACFRTSIFSIRSKRGKDFYQTDYSVRRIYAHFSAGLSELRFNIHGLGLVPIQQTPHFEFFSSPDGEQRYRDYVSRFYGRAAVETTVERFKGLGKFIELHPDRLLLLGIVTRPVSPWILILDGTHRAAWAAHNLYKEIRVGVANR